MGLKIAMLHAKPFCVRREIVTCVTSKLFLLCHAGTEVVENCRCGITVAISSQTAHRLDCLEHCRHVTPGCTYINVLQPSSQRVSVAEVPISMNNSLDCSVLVELKILALVI